jgi:hypothetical protein
MAREAPRDWTEWHQQYDEPDSRLARRLAVVQEQLRRAIDERPDPLRIISMCAGEGRDVLGVLADHPRRGEVSALLVELDADIAGRAEAAARDAGLDGVRVRCADAAVTDSYADAAPAEIVLACGIFGNIPDDDIRRTVGYLPTLCAAGATVIWTRGRWPGTPDVPQDIRRWFGESGFDEVAFVASDAETFRVGAHRLVAPPRPLEPGERLFTFFR